MAIFARTGAMMLNRLITRVLVASVPAVLASCAVDDPAIALAKIVDAALVLINQDTVDRDRFLAARAAAPVASGGVQSTSVHHGDPVTVEVWPPAIDEATVVQVDTSDGVGRLRININDGAVYDGDPDSDDPPGAFLPARGVDSGARAGVGCW